MLEQFQADFGSLIDDVANRLQRQLIDATGTNYIEAGPADRLAFNAPPLRPSPDLLGLSLHRIPLYLYGTPLDRPTIFATWQVVVDTVVNGEGLRKVTQALDAAMPSLPFAGSAVEQAVQFIYAAGWFTSAHGMQPAFGPSTAVLKFRQASIGVDQSAILWQHPTRHQCRRRIRDMQAVSVNEALSMPLGSRSTAPVRISALYQRLCAVLPHLADQLHYIFSAAIAAGPDYQARLLAPFDVVINKDLTPDPYAGFDEARRLILTAQSNPTPQLYRILRERVGYARLVQAFGNPHRPAGAYSAKTRARHLLELDQLHTTNREDPAADALSLVRFQQMLGRPHVN